MLKFLKSNIKHALTKQTLLSLLMVLVQIFSVIVIVFSYGIINHYNFKVSERESSTLVYDFITRGDDENITVSMEQVDEFMTKSLPYIQDKLDYFFIMGYMEEFCFQCSSGYREGRFTVSKQIKKNIGVISGEKFTEAQMNSTDKIVIAHTSVVDEEGYVTIEGVKYKAIGVLPEAYAERYIFVPYKVMPDNTEVFYISFLLEQPLWEGEYNEIVKMLKETFGDVFKIPEFEGVINESSNRVYRDVMLVTGFLILVCVVNYCIMYRYMLEKRRKQFAITRICGCSRYMAGIVYMLELLGASIITLIAGIILYHQYILPEAKEHFRYIGLFYGDHIYQLITLIYMGVLSISYLFLVCRFVRKTPAALIREV